MDIKRIAELANIKLVHGVALVIVGAQGSGKTTFAEIIAAKHGFHDASSCSFHEFAGKFNPIFSISPDVVIVEDVTFDTDTSLVIKRMLTQRLMVHLKGKEEYEIATPRFIFTTNTAPVIDPDCRRFHVVHI